GDGAFAQEELGQVKRLIEHAAGGPAQVKQDAAQPALLERAHDPRQLQGNAAVQAGEAQVSDLARAVEPVVPVVVVRADDAEHRLRPEVLPLQLNLPRLLDTGPPQGKHEALVARVVHNLAGPGAIEDGDAQQPGPNEGIALHRLVIDVSDLISGPQAGPLGGASGNDLLEEERAVVAVRHQVKAQPP